MRVAIIGGGIAGMGAALRLAERGVDVELFEAERRLGGDCWGAEVEDETGARHIVDVGVSDFNQASFPRCAALFADLGLAVAPICQDASFMTTDRRLVYHTRGGELVIPPGLPGAATLRRDIEAFKRAAREVLADPALASTPCAAFLAAGGYSPAFRELWFEPRALARFSTPHAPLGEQPIGTFVRFWHMHGIVGVGGSERMCVVGGMHSYCARVEQRLRDLGASLRLGQRVLDVSRDESGVRVRAEPPAQGLPRVVTRADAAIIATDANQVVPLLADADAREREAYGASPTQAAWVVVHSDPDVMPIERASWGAYNFVVARPGERVDPPTITYWPRLLARAAGVTHGGVFVAVNPTVAPDPRRVLFARAFTHPVADGQTAARASRIEALQGSRRVWVCGSYLEDPFLHENALASGQRAADRLLAAHAR